MTTSTLIMIIAIVYYMVLPSLKTRTMPVKRMIITPAIFMYLCYETLQKSFLLNPVSLAYAIAGAVIGMLLGMLLRFNTQLVADKAKQMIQLPGSYLSLITFSLIFIMHYWVGYNEAVSPHYFANTEHSTLMTIFFLTLVSSISAGANLFLYYKYENQMGLG